MSRWILVLSAVALGLMFTSPALACDTASGEIRKVDSAKYMLVLNKSGCCPSSGGEMTFVLKKDTKVQLNGKSATLADLRTGDKVQVSYEKLDDVLSVTVTREG